MMRPPRRTSKSIQASRSRAKPVFCTLGDTLCRVRVWTERQWEQLDPGRRPAAAVHRPGFGWFAPVPVRDLY
jgi:hypothetical protein